jgi:hypothetical protein
VVSQRTSATRKVAASSVLRDTSPVPACYIELDVISLNITEHHMSDAEEYTAFPKRPYF